MLVLDDVGMRKLAATEAQDLREILEERSVSKSAVFTTQLSLDHWADVIADPVIADAIRDRLQHAALTITSTGQSYRGIKARKLAGRDLLRQRTSECAAGLGGPSGVVTMSVAATDPVTSRKGVFSTLRRLRCQERIHSRRGTPRSELVLARTIQTAAGISTPIGVT